MDKWTDGQMDRKQLYKKTTDRQMDRKTMDRQVDADINRHIETDK